MQYGSTKRRGWRDIGNPFAEARTELALARAADGTDGRAPAEREGQRFAVSSPVRGQGDPDVRVGGGAHRVPHRGTRPRLRLRLPHARPHRLTAGSPTDRTWPDRACGRPLQSASPPRPGPTAQGGSAIARAAAHDVQSACWPRRFGARRRVRHPLSAGRGRVLTPVNRSSTPLTRLGDGSMTGRRVGDQPTATFPVVARFPSRYRSRRSRHPATIDRSVEPS